MIRVDVAGLVLDSQEQPVVLLRPLEGAGPRRILPIWIGLQEATAIMLALDGATTERPMSYDLMVRLLERLGASVRQVAVTRLEQGTFYAEITLDSPAGVQVIDARPSDSIALAVRTGAPILVAQAVLDEAGLPEEASEAADASAASETPDADAQLDEFTRFLDTVNPDDFRG